MRFAATGALLAIAVATASASPAKDLGDAFRAYDAGDLVRVRTLVARLDARHVANDDYLYWLRGMVALRSGDVAGARAAFALLAREHGSRFAREVPWRLADVDWLAEPETAGKAYRKLIAGAGAGDLADVGTARYRIAKLANSAAAYRDFLIQHPAHPLAATAERALAALGGPPFTGPERITRSQQLTAAHLWDEAVAELSLLGGPQSPELTRQRDYFLGITLFKMRRRYGEAGDLLLRVYPEMGGAAAEAMFHGARALSRADRDDEAITWYRKVVAQYPASEYAAEAAFLTGWLEFNRGRYQAAIARSRPRWRSIRSPSGSTMRCGSSGCRTTSSATGSTPATGSPRWPGAAARWKAARAPTGWRGSTTSSASKPTRSPATPRPSSAIRSRGTRCSVAPGSPSSASRLARSVSPIRCGAAARWRPPSTPRSPPTT